MSYLLCHYWLLKDLLSSIYFLIFVREANRHCVPDKYSCSLGYSDANLCTDQWRKLDQLHHCLCQSSSGAALYSLPEPCRFHRGWNGAEAQRRHEGVSFYSLNLLPLSAGESQQKEVRGTFSFIFEPWACKQSLEHGEWHLQGVEVHRAVKCPVLTPCLSLKSPVWRPKKPFCGFLLRRTVKWRYYICRTGW